MSGSPFLRHFQGAFLPGGYPGLKPHKRQFNEAVIFSAEGATGLKPGVERSGTPRIFEDKDENKSKEFGLK